MLAFSSFSNKLDLRVSSKFLTEEILFAITCRTESLTDATLEEMCIYSVLWLSLHCFIKIN